MMSYRRFGRARSLRSDRTLVRARSLSSDRAEWAFGRYVAILLEFLSDDSSLFRKGFRKEESISKKYSSEKFPTFFFFGDLDVNFVVTIFDPNTKFRCGDGRGYISGADSDFSGRSAGLRCRSSLLSREVSSSPSRERKCSSRRRVTVLFCTGRCSGHGTEGVTPRDTGTLAGSVGPDASALPAGSSTTPILVEDKGRAADSMPLPPARKEIVLALHAPSVVPVIQPKGRKRKFTNGGDGESSQQGGSSIASGLRGKFVSLIDGMISECGSETSRLAGELLELQGRWSETEAMMTAVKGSHSVKSQNVFHRFYERNLMTLSFLERNGQPEVDLATIGRKASLCARCYIYSRVFFVINVFDAFP
ncbi:hypothetical protein F2Q68_00043944 [Brassica cretica]|uniref:Uncharacterized protein n=1 Tax=Brassica cretica TaxID=69181 RepID=A0A8S9LN58_BRACR|nr:hypothetical protein F2Q68_00043944 [Brassica cretica]